MTTALNPPANAAGLHPLFERLVAETGAAVLHDAATFDTWAGQAGAAMVVFAEDPERRATAGPGPGGEDDRVAIGERRIDLVVGRVLQVEDHRFASGRPDVLGLSRIPDQAAGVLPALSDQRGEHQSDLSVATNNCRFHLKPPRRAGIRFLPKPP